MSCNRWEPAIRKARPVLSQPAMGVLVRDTLPQSPPGRPGCARGWIPAVDGSRCIAGRQQRPAQPGRRELTLRTGKG